MKSLLKRMQATLFLVLLACTLACTANALSAAPETSTSFPAAAPESQGMPSAALDSLARIVQGYFHNDEIVGAELLVIKNRRSVLHRAFGWRDREDSIPMAENTAFNLRSMTKPITGAGIQMLIDQGKLRLEDKAADYLPSFKSESTADITIEQLLTHRSGLPLTALKDRSDLEKYPDLVAMANAIGAAGTEFEPGSKFWYSDAGSDVLGAVTEIASGMPLEQFRRQAILDPLGMKDTFTLSKQDTSRMEEVASLYFGSPGNWQAFWKPSDPPFYPLAWGSQTLYGTPMDYAQFLAMWMDRGKACDEQILSSRAIESSLKPISRMKSLGVDDDYPTTFPHHAVYYGQMAMVYLDGELSDATRPSIFGHHGSDGTYAWAWPDLDLMVLYFTQSRGGTSGLKLEREIYRLLINPDDKPSRVGIPKEFEPLLGKYTASLGVLPDAEYTVLVQDGKLALDIPGKMVFELTEPDDKGIRHFVIADLVGVAFDEDDTGKTAALRILETTPIQRAPEQPDSLLLNVRDEYLPYVGKYLLGPLRKEILVRVVDGKLAIDFVDEGVVKLADPDNEEGRWYFEGRRNASATFPRDDTGSVLAMNLLGVTRVRRGRCSACLFEKVLGESGVEQAIAEYRGIKANQADEYVFHERGLNALGYRLLNENKTDDAIQVFKLNVDEYPGAFNVYDSLGEAYLKKGDKELARQNYEKSLELNPANESAKKMLEQMEKAK